MSRIASFEMGGAPSWATAYLTGGGDSPFQDPNFRQPTMTGQSAPKAPYHFPGSATVNVGQNLSKTNIRTDNSGGPPSETLQNGHIVEQAPVAAKPAAKPKAAAPKDSLGPRYDINPSSGGWFSRGNTSGMGQRSYKPGTSPPLSYPGKPPQTPPGAAKPAAGGAPPKTSVDTTRGGKPWGSVDYTKHPGGPQPAAYVRDATAPAQRSLGAGEREWEVGLKTVVSKANDPLLTQLQAENKTRDPLNWGEIARNLGNAGDLRFSQWKSQPLQFGNMANAQRHDMQEAARSRHAVLTGAVPGAVVAAGTKLPPMVNPNAGRSEGVAQGPRVASQAETAKMLKQGAAQQMIGQARLKVENYLSLGGRANTQPYKPAPRSGSKAPLMTRFGPR